MATSYYLWGFDQNHVYGAVKYYSAILRCQEECGFNAVVVQAGIGDPVKKESMISWSASSDSALLMAVRR